MTTTRSMAAEGVMGDMVGVPPFAVISGLQVQRGESAQRGPVLDPMMNPPMSADGVPACNSDQAHRFG